MTGWAHLFRPGSRARRAGIINGAFLGQVITGQQRYAHEISRRLTLDEQLPVAEPPDSVRGRALFAWVWCLMLPLRTSARPIISLTSRGPVTVRTSIQVVHDLFVLTHPEWFSRKYALTHKPLLLAQIRWSKHIVAVSEPVAEELRRRFGRRGVVVAPNAPAEMFSIARAKSKLQTVLESYGLSDSGYILSVGSLEPRKNISRLLSSYSKVRQEGPSVPLVLVGGEFSSFKSLDIARQEGVVKLGYVPDEDLASLYLGARLVVFLSIDEGFGLPAVEALACGAQILVSDIPVMRWVCGELATYVDPLSVESIAASLSIALESTRVTDNMQAARAQAIRSRFDWNQSAATIANLTKGVSSDG